MNPAPAPGLLIDTNLLVLLTVGAVNRNRIETLERRVTELEHRLNINPAA